MKHLEPSDAWIERARSVPIESEIKRRGIKLKRSGGELIGPCPRCGGDDRFGVNIAKQIFNCRGCGAKGDVIDLVRFLDDCDFIAAGTTLAGEPPEPKMNGANHHAAEPKKIATAKYKYKDEAGNLAFGVVRVEYQNADGSFLETKDGKRKKTFKQGRPDPERPGKWIWKVDGAPVVPYRLPELIEAVSSGHFVVVVEGEAKADLLRSWNMPATCNAGGAGKWKPEHSAFLRGADVLILPDNDTAGCGHCDVVGASLQGVAASVRVLELPNLEPKQDIVDWAAAGGTVEQLHDLIAREAKPWAPGNEKAESASKFRFNLDGIPLHIDQWLNRNLADPDRLIGEWLTSTSRAILNAETGLGKTNFGMAIGGHGGAGVNFMHWHIPRPIRVLYVDGEMSNRLLKLRAADVVRRLPAHPKGLHLLNRQDAPDMPPLNTAAGAAFIHEVIDRIGGVDMIELDNVMSLISGSMKDEEAWQQTLPFIDSLTRRCIGQLWIHHTGYDTSHGYGTKTREWQMDTVLIGTAAKRDDTDVSFTLEFPKARERTPQTRHDFDPVTIALVNDEWISSAAKVEAQPPSPVGAKFLAALINVFAGSDTIPFQAWKAVKIDHWQMECERMGLVEKGKTSRARAAFSHYKLELITRNHIACNDDLVWTIK